MKQGIYQCPVHGDNETTPRCPDCRPYNTIDPNTLWFNTPDTFSLCRGGNNGPKHESQLYAIKKYVKDFETFLDYGCGSGTTLEALEKANLIGIAEVYKGVDIIPKNIEWCKEKWPLHEWEVNPSLHKIDQPDKSFDVVYSRHVVDHMESFEKAMDEHCRVAKQLVIVTLWVPLSTSDEHQIKNIDYRPSGGKLYPNEYTNSYSRMKVMDYLYSKKDWVVLDIAEDVGVEVSGHDTVIVLKKI